MKYHILSPYIAFVGVETRCPEMNGSETKVPNIAIQISKVAEHLMFQQITYLSDSGREIKER